MFHEDSFQQFSNDAKNQHFAVLIKKDLWNDNYINLVIPVGRFNK